MFVFTNEYEHGCTLNAMKTKSDNFNNDTVRCKDPTKMPLATSKNITQIYLLLRPFRQIDHD